tara:strand:+ start:178 stop:456 length:279 start_codon:yes stop_codon:yes gene_type:complete
MKIRIKNNTHISWFDLEDGRKEIFLRDPENEEDISFLFEDPEDFEYFALKMGRILKQQNSRDKYWKGKTVKKDIDTIRMKVNRLKKQLKYVD